MTDTAPAPEETTTASNTYIIRPNFQHNISYPSCRTLLCKIGLGHYLMSNKLISIFRPIIVKECLHNVLNDHLTGKTYDAQETTDLTKTIADDIKLKLKEMMKMYRMGCRCFWDSDTDSYAEDIFMNVVPFSKESWDSELQVLTHITLQYDIAYH
ncbi:hypothetical protein KUTeg_012659 [Tegillarca granosa]|uniref:Uncharacterized protein n=1 Tax=Tegillarca granosa TaxID=220873 RepID=A0ABQ9F044_TEGGR|nr:hypothetical protein KUTeg_012659 [Tegillarca granosa]